MENPTHPFESLNTDTEQAATQLKGNVEKWNDEIQNELNWMSLVIKLILLR